MLNIARMEETSVAYACETLGKKGYLGASLMRVAVFCPTVSGTGGMESAIQNLIAGFEALGDSVHLFLFGGSYDEAWLEGLSFTTFGNIHSSRPVRLLNYGIGAIKAVRTWRPDYIICADGTTLQMARFGRTVCRNSKILIASWLHFPLEETRKKSELSKADFHLAISGQLAEELRTYFKDSKVHIATIYNALHSGQAFLVQRPKKNVFLYVGRLNYDDHKRVNDILLAVSSLRGEWTLRIIGDTGKGQEEHGIRLKKLAAELGIENRIEWMGWQLKPWVAAGEVTALVSSSSREAFGMALLEACSHGVACISSDCVGPRDFIVPMENGWFYPVADVKALAGIMQSIIDHPELLPPQDVVVRSTLRFSAEAVATRAKDAFYAAVGSKASLPG